MDLPDPRRFLRRGAAVAANALARLPGPRPPWVIVELRGSYPERHEPRRWLALPPDFGPRDTPLEHLARELDALGRAPWCRGVVLRFGPTALGPARARALRELVLALRDAGKETVALLVYADLLAYWVATAADRIVTSEAVGGGSWGIAAEALYWGDALGRAGVAFDRVRVREYKTAFEAFARSTMSDAQREQVGALLHDVEDTIVRDVAAARGRDEATVRSWLDRPPTRRSEVVERGLVDRIGYEDEAIPEGAVPAARAARFLRRRVPAPSARVGVVSLVGAIVPGESRRSPVPVPLLGGAFAGSETLIRTLRAVADDATTGAVVLYVESPGGSALASDLIWREVQLLDRRKPVVAVMGDVAASGGYYVLTHARRVVASPVTVTGSIGVIAGKFVLEGLYQRLGIHVERIALHRFAGVYSSARAFDDEERAHVEASVQEIYTQFIRRVADGRGLPLERVDEIARGRIWSGRAAQALGLVDELGGVPAAIAAAKRLAGLPSDAPVWNVRPPRHPAPPQAPSEVEALLAQVRAERTWLLPGVDVRIRG